MFLFEAIDYTGRKIRLTQEQWKHIMREHQNIHPEEIKEALFHPLLIKASDLQPECVHYYYRYIKNIRKYLMVAVKYLNGEGFIITAYYTKTLQ